MFHSELCGEICNFYLNFLLCMGQLHQLQHLYKTTLFPYYHIILQVLMFLLKHGNTGILKKVVSIQRSWKHCSVPKEMGETSGKNKKKNWLLPLLAVTIRGNQNLFDKTSSIFNIKMNRSYCT